MTLGYYPLCLLFHLLFRLSRVQTIWGKYYMSHCDQVQRPLQVGSHFWSGLQVLLKSQTAIDKNKLKVPLTLRPGMQPHTPCNLLSPGNEISIRPAPCSPAKQFTQVSLTEPLGGGSSSYFPLDHK